MKEIYLIRHGETDWNRSGMTMGNQDIPLNELGREQAKLTAQRLSHVQFDQFLSSDLKRAKETAEMIAKSQAIEPVFDPLLREINLAGFEGLPGEELRAQFPHSYKIIGDEERGAVRKPSPQTETRLDLLKRVGNRFDVLWGDAGYERLLIVCHGGVIRCILNHVMNLRSNLSDQLFYSLGVHCDNCSISIIESEANNMPIFRVINETSHLSR